MMTPEPPPAAFRWGRPSRISSAACPALSANVAVKSPGPALLRLPLPTVPPALATRRSRPPRAAAISSTARLSASMSVTSAVVVVTGVSWLARRLAAVARPLPLRATRPTATPSAASASAAAKPMPLLPPVIRARRPRSSRSMLTPIPALVIGPRQGCHDEAWPPHPGGPDPRRRTLSQALDSWDGRDYRLWHGGRRHQPRRPGPGG